MGRRFYINNGKPYISVTTILKSLQPHKLQNWLRKTDAKKIEGVSSKAANAGTEIHQEIEKKLSGQVYVLPDFINKWLDENIKETVLTEPVLCHEKYKYAGSADLIANKRIFDWKTGRGSTQHGHQMAAYYLAALEMGIEVDGFSTVYIDMKKEEVKEFAFTHLDFCIDAFLHTYQAYKALNFYLLQKAIEVDGKEVQIMSLDEVKLDVFRDYWGLK
jgi:hypothetical protein